MHKICLVLLAISIQANDIRISEVMSNPQGSEYENEFIEIFNATDHVMQINDWVLSDGNGEDTISHFSGPSQIQPGRYAIILDPGYSYGTGPYAEFLNDSLSIYTISTDGSFGSGGLSNAGESVHIRSPDSTLKSEMSWTSSSQNGYSWERVSVAIDDSMSTWEQSLTINGTPGFRNSVTPPLFNLGITGVVLEVVQINEPVEITLNIHNIGEYSVSGFSVNAFRDENQNGTIEAGEWSYREDYVGTLVSQEVLELSLELFILSSGVHHVGISIITEFDEVEIDDSLQFEVIGLYPRNTLSITEIMYSPSTDQAGEWVELQNRSAGPVSLQGWTMSDANQTRHFITDSLLFLESFEYLTLCASSLMANYFGLSAGEVYELDSWPALNSSSDSVRLFDAAGHAVATAYYRGAWGESAVSLERRHPETHPLDELNWLPSTNLDGGTPSRMNTRHLLPVEIRIEDITVETQSIAGPGQAEVRIEFQNLGMDTLYSLELESDADIYWHGVLPSFENDSLIFTSFTLWPGFNTLPIRILYEEEILADTSILVIMGFPPDQIAINEIHYNPHEDQPEFLEFINIGSSVINLRGWSFIDRSGARGQVMNDLLIQPDSLVLWTANENKLTDWAPSNAKFCELSNWPSLNNSSDSIIIQDPLGQRMSAHAYENPPGGMIGKSLERVALWKPQELESSWSICEDPQGITPGRVNSLLFPPRNLLIQELEILDSILWVNEAFMLEVTIVNPGVDLAENARLNVRLSHEESEIDFLFDQLPLIGVGDTLIWEAALTSFVTGRIVLRVELDYEGDEVSEDDSISQQLYISGGASPLVINEIMPLPLVDQQEWLEIYNRSSAMVDILGWSIADNSGSKTSISDTSFVMEGNSYLVIGGDPLQIADMYSGYYIEVAQFPTLNNTDELLILSDPQGIPMDEMSYSSATELATGRSLERIRPVASGQEVGNWGVCISDLGSTPGMRNSLYLNVLPEELDVELSPNPFSPNGDGDSDQLIVEYELPFEHGLMSIMVFDMAGRKIAEPEQIKPVSHRGQVLWDGEANYGGKAVTGLYIMKLLFDDQDGKVWSSLKKVYLIR